jgi:hypothetical protein
VIGGRLKIFLFGILLSLFGCTSHSQLPQLPKPKVKPTPTQPSSITVEVNSGGPVVVTTSAAEFQVRPDGYVQAFLLLKDGRKLSLDEPRVGALSDSDYAVVGGKEVHFTLDFQQAKVLEAIGKMGAGKRLEILAHPMGPSGTALQRMLVFEAYDRYPNVLLASVEYKNIGSTGMRIEKTMDQRHRFSAKLVESNAQSWEVWSYHRVGGEENKGEVVRLNRHFARRNALEPGKGPAGRDLAVVAFWTDEVGEAIGHLDTLPMPAAIPVKVDSDGRVDVQLELATDAMLMPGETYSSPRNFLSVYGGDASEPQHLWSAIPQKEIAEPPKPQSPIR